ncbi:MAG: flavin reductase family protein [Saprospiraceae bacterium]|nr:flavin reductase family protein [Saprospiraceae bacterium]
MLSFEPKDLETKDLHQFLLGIVSPRPIAFVSTIDENGEANLAPYSFFNAFSSNPPIVVFSSNRRVANNTTKDTLANIKATGECVINAVSYDIVRQMAVASVEFPKGINEFEKTGLTPVASDIIKPFRVKESLAALECKVADIITLGEKGGAGHLIICNVVKLHVSETVVDDRNRIDPNKIDLMGRLGRAYYVRVKGDQVFPIVQSVTDMVIGYDQLPDAIKHSNIFTGNNIGQLAGIDRIPTSADLDAVKEKYPEATNMLQKENAREQLHSLAKSILDTNDKNRWDAACLAWMAE